MNRLLTDKAFQKAVARRAANMCSMGEEITPAVIIRAYQAQVDAENALSLELLENKTERAKEFNAYLVQAVYEKANE